jgi:hypothetical protein
MMGEIVPATRESLLELFYAVNRSDADTVRYWPHSAAVAAATDSLLPGHSTASLLAYPSRSGPACLPGVLPAGALPPPPAPQVVRQLVALGIVVPTSDLLSIRRSIAYFIDGITKQAQQQEAVGVIGEDLFAIALVRWGGRSGKGGEGVCVCVSLPVLGRWRAAQPPAGRPSSAAARSAASYILAAGLPASGPPPCCLPGAPQDQPFRFPAAFTFVLRAFATLEGIGKALDPDFKFVAVAAPYATELLDLRSPGSQSTLLLGQLQQQAAELGAAAAAVPQRVARIDSTLAQLESGDLKLRVRVLEAERAARRSGVVQVKLAPCSPLACAFGGRRSPAGQAAQGCMQRTCRAAASCVAPSAWAGAASASGPARLATLTMPSAL